MKFNKQHKPTKLYYVLQLSCKIGHAYIEDLCVNAVTDPDYNSITIDIANGCD